MMVLTVNVIGERAAQRDEARSWSCRREPSFRHDEPKDFRKANACLGAKIPLSASKAMNRSRPRMSMSAPPLLRQELP